MNRKLFLKSLALTPLAMHISSLNSLESWSHALPYSEKMPVLFLGHGSPMNVIEDNQFVRGFKEIVKSIPRPKAIPRATTLSSLYIACRFVPVKRSRIRPVLGRLVRGSDQNAACWNGALSPGSPRRSPPALTWPTGRARACREPMI